MADPCLIVSNTAGLSSKRVWIVPGGMVKVRFSHSCSLLLHSILWILLDFWATTITFGQLVGRSTVKKTLDKLGFKWPAIQLIDGKKSLRWLTTSYFMDFDISISQYNYGELEYLKLSFGIKLNWYFTSNLSVLQWIWTFLNIFHRDIFKDALSLAVRILAGTGIWKVRSDSKAGLVKTMPQL